MYSVEDLLVADCAGVEESVDANGEVERAGDGRIALEDPGRTESDTRRQRSSAHRPGVQGQRHPSLPDT